jgi:glycerol-1-phosphatase
MARLLDRHDALFVDLDGVLYRGDEAVPKAAEAVAAARRAGVRVLFLTNNSARTPRQVADRLATVGAAAAPEEILTSGRATATVLADDGAGRTAFVIGERGVREALSEAGIRVLDGEPDRADLVVVGWDRSVDYAKLRRATLLVRAGARLVATNPDRTYPAPEGLWPGAGAILAAVVAATDAVPLIVGKPFPPLFRAAATITSARHPLVIGDRLDTDVAGAEGVGWDSLLVLTGASTRADLLRSDALPTYVARVLDALFQDVPPARFRPARRDDERVIAELLDAAGLSSAGVGDRQGGTVVSWSEDETALEATACCETIDGFGLIRSVAVRPGSRDGGLGALAVAHAARLGRRLGAGRLYLFTETAVSFFQGLGFHPVDRGSLPDPLAASRQAREECAALATAMELVMTGG